MAVTASSPPTSSLSRSIAGPLRIFLRSDPLDGGSGVTADQMREMRWTQPQLVAQFQFVEWTAEGHLRHAGFLGLRVDKTATEVVREG